MVLLVFIIGAVNLAIGAALAVIVSRRVPAVTASPKIGRSWLRLVPTVPERLRPWLPVPAGGEAPTDPDEDVDAPVPDPSPHEAVLWDLREQLVEVRHKIAEADGRLRATSEAEAMMESIAEPCDHWLCVLEEYVPEDAGDSESAALSCLIRGHADRFRSVWDTLAQGDRSDAASWKHGTLALVKTMDDLAVQIDQLLVSCLVASNRLTSLAENDQIDPSSECLNRLGGESLFVQWRGQDPHGVRLVVGVLLMVDDVDALFDRAGIHVGDAILAALGRYTSTLVRKNRGFDRVLRLAPTSFLLFVNDMAAVNAFSGAERIRQCIAGAEFATSEDTFAVTVSCSVTELRRGEGLRELHQRLLDGVQMAIDAGGNRTVLDEGQGFQLAEPIDYPIQSRTIEVAR